MTSADFFAIHHHVARIVVLVCFHSTPTTLHEISPVRVKLSSHVTARLTVSGFGAVLTLSCDVDLSDLIRLDLASVRRSVCVRLPSAKPHAYTLSSNSSYRCFRSGLSPPSFHQSGAHQTHLLTT